ncbi:MAG: ribonuclease III [Gammaproteobacteria bacterium]|nr:ribonuclease III [Gammaproteobacteria bacterium]
MTNPRHWAAGTLDYSFKDEELLRRALTHRSAGGLHNERLEFLGDAVLGLVIARALYAVRPNASEGILSRYRALLVRRETLAELGRGLGIGEQLALGSGELRSGGHQRHSILADALEAVLGAIYLDGGFGAVEQVIMRLYADRLDALPPEQELIDAKTALQELLQARGLPPPAYELKATAGPAHAQRFTASCEIEALDLQTTGDGSSRRRAEQAAAALALAQLADAD